MKKIVLLVVLVISMQAYGQRKPVEKFYLWDVNFKPVEKQESAHLFYQRPEIE